MNVNLTTAARRTAWSRLSRDEKRQRRNRAMQAQFPRTAEELAFAADPGARRIGPNRWAFRCFVHDDRRPSCHASNGSDGKILVICRAGCSQGEVLAALRARGLWPEEREPYIKAPPIDWGVAESKLSPCCFEGPPHGCEHWRLFDQKFLLAHLRANLMSAAEEIKNLYKTARELLTAEELTQELEFACRFGSIVPYELEAATVTKMIKVVAANMLQEAAA